MRTGYAFYLSLKSILCAVNVSAEVHSYFTLDGKTFTNVKIFALCFVANRITRNNQLHSRFMRKMYLRTFGKWTHTNFSSNFSILTKDQLVYVLITICFSECGKNKHDPDSGHGHDVLRKSRKLSIIMLNLKVTTVTSWTSWWTK